MAFKTGVNVISEKVDQPALPDATAWAALHTRPRCEKVVARYLRDRGAAVFLPTVTNRRTYGARVRVSELPLFPGYLFFDSGAIERRAVYEAGRIVQVLYPDDSGELAADLENLARTLARPEGARSRDFGPPGTPVIVVEGPLTGVVGELVRYERHAALVIHVRFLGFAAELTIEESCVRPR